jgi:Vitamin K-dependent gamma-carboxylase
MVSAIALTVGWHSRIAAVLVFVLIMSLGRRDFMVFNSGDVLVRIEALLLAISSCGAALSLDQRRATGSFWSAQTRPRWPIRLMQVQLSLIYFSTVQAKLSGDTWREGTAVSYALRYEDMLLMPIPDWLRTNGLLMNVATWATLVLEIMIGILVWNRRLYPWVLAAGAVMRTMIMATIAVGFFSLAMFVLYLAFVQPDTVRRWIDHVKGVATQLRCRRPRAADPKRITQPEVSHTPSPPADDDRTGQGPKRCTKVLTGRLESARRVKSTSFGRRNWSTSADASTNEVRAGINART